MTGWTPTPVGAWCEQHKVYDCDERGTCGAYLPAATVDVCNYCRLNPPEPGQVVCRACMDRIPPWEVTG